MYEGGTSRANIEATTAELYEFVRPSFTGEVVEANQVVSFLRCDDYLKALWQNEVEAGIPFRIEPLEDGERDPVVKKMWRFLREWNDNQGLGYDQITYR